MTAPHADQIIAGYLARLEAALALLPSSRRRELVDDVAGHIAEARAGLSEEADADILTIIDRLGDPSEMAAEEMERTQPAAPAASTALGGGRSNLLESILVLVAVAAILLSPIFTAVYLGRRLKRRTTIAAGQPGGTEPRLVG
jgi:uncharacterized membrane protein